MTDDRRRKLIEIARAQIINHLQSDLDGRSERVMKEAGEQCDVEDLAVMDAELRAIIQSIGDRPTASPSVDLAAWFSMHIDLGVPRVEDRMKMHAILDELVLLRSEVKRLGRGNADLVKYIDDAKLAFGEERVSGEPLADAIRRLREELADVRDDLGDHRTALAEMVADGRAE